MRHAGGVQSAFHFGPPRAPHRAVPRVRRAVLRVRLDVHVRTDRIGCMYVQCMYVQKESGEVPARACSPPWISPPEKVGVCRAPFTSYLRAPPVVLCHA